MKIAIVFGGSSYEHEISIVSAIAMRDVIKSELEYIFLDENRDFYHIPTKTIKSKLFSTGEYKKCDKLNIKKGGFSKKAMFGEKNVEFDIVLNLIHGGDGEDGTVASLFEFFDIRYIGPRVGACSVSFNKFLTKGYASSLSIKTIPYQYFTKFDEVIVEQFPVIVKPVTLGSSIGVSIVKSKEELSYALDVAFEFDNAVLIETFVPNIKEYNLAGYKIGNEIKYSIVEEPQKADFLDFDKKYLDFARTERVSVANISDELKDKLKKAFATIYNTTFNDAMIRCDFFVIDDEVYLNEINPIPGSMANYLFEDFDASIKELSKSLKLKDKIKISYDYVNKIQAAKGK
ncbi:MAG: D-alanine--D-alanine ligase [Arcobacter sp.]|uniref:D-alanine--D-alanine ligase n=1 Tax=Arcobacter sp. TaxID=1872629 RepID=UPI003C716271